VRGRDQFVDHPGRKVRARHQKGKIREAEVPTMTDITFHQERHDFSLVLGGPFFQFLQKSHLSGSGLELLHRRLLVITLVAWLPLLFLASLGSLFGNVGGLSFLRDFEVHIRLLIALPALLAAELIVHSRIRPVVHCFVKRRIVSPDDLPSFDSAIESAIRLRNSTSVGIALVILVYTFGLWLWNSRTAIESATWYAMPGGRWHLTPAGFWCVFVSIPIFQFILLLWYLRILIWFCFLWQVSKINLNLIPTHPDRCAGLAFLGKSAYAFGPILFAESAMLAGVIANRILYRGDSLQSLKLQIAGIVAFFILTILGPLTMFTPRMVSAKNKGLADYGLLAQSCVERFERKWIVHDLTSDEGRRAKSCLGLI
jgi:hypothetical protein